MDTSASKSVYEARTLGAEQYSLYKEGVFVLGRKSIYETIKCNKLSLYKNTSSTHFGQYIFIEQILREYPNLY